MAWYPAANVTGCRRRPYLDEREANAAVQTQLRLAQLSQEIAAGLGRLESASHLGAPIATGRFPPLVYTHGGTSNPQNNMALAEHLVSHGIIVLSVSHPYESGGHLLADRTFMPFNSVLLEGMMALLKVPGYPLVLFDSARTLAERLAAAPGYIKGVRQTVLPLLSRTWAADNIFMVDHLSDGDVPECAKRAAGAADLDRMSYFGMSLGGYVTTLCCLTDPRAKAGTNFDGGCWTAEPLGREIGGPFLALTSDLSLVRRQLVQLGVITAAQAGGERVPISSDGMTMLDLLYQRLDRIEPAAPVHRISIRDVLHWGWADISLLFPGQMPESAGVVPVERLHPAICRLVEGFFATYLTGADRAFPSACASAFDDIVVLHDRAAMMRRYG